MRRLAELVTQYGRYGYRRIGGSPNPGGSAGTCLPLRQLSAILVRMPKKRTAGPAPLSEQLRKAIDASGHTRYAIVKETGISQSTLSRFMFRYVDAECFRFNHRKTDDAGRLEKAVAGASGKRLTYHHLTGKDRRLPPRAIPTPRAGEVQTPTDRGRGWRRTGPS
ncbi:MAG TPA: hypothetical protein VF170_01970 [Planctomycetaceae bacterium]